MSQLLSSSFPHSHFEVPGSRNNPRAALQDYPGCQMLRDAYRRIHKIPNKTPLSMLYEYASRLNLELSFEEGQDSEGLFTVASKLLDLDGSVIHRPGIGKARGKKDAKQLAAAALVEILLETVPFQDLLHKSEKHQLKEMRAATAAAAAQATWMLPESGAMSSPHALAPLSQADTNTYAVFTSQPQLIGQATSACATAPSTASYGPLAICSQPGPPNPAVTMGNPVTGHSEFLGPTHGVELGMHAPCSIANAFSPGLLFGGETAAAAAAEYMNFPAAAAPPQHLNNFGGHLHQQTMPGLTSNLLGNYNAPASGSAFCSSGLPHLDTNQYGANNFLLEPPGAWGHQGPNMPTNCWAGNNYQAGITHAQEPLKYQHTYANASGLQLPPWT